METEGVAGREIGLSDGLLHLALTGDDDHVAINVLPSDASVEARLERVQLLPQRRVDVLVSGELRNSQGFDETAKFLHQLRNRSELSLTDLD